MSMEQSESSRSYLWLLAVGLGLYCIVLTAFTGDIGFTGDDWWVLAVPYWNSFPHAIARYACQFPTGGRTLLDHSVQALRL